MYILSVKLLSGPVIMILGIHPKELKTYVLTQAYVIAALFTTAKT